MKHWYGFEPILGGVPLRETLLLNRTAFPNPTPPSPHYKRLRRKEIPIGSLTENRELALSQARAQTAQFSGSP